jgi:molybdate transport system substrate-binding protein
MTFHRIDFKRVYLGFVLLVFVVFGCKNKSLNDNTPMPSVNPKTQLTIYCENSIAPMIVEFKTHFEQEYNCDVRIINDCSQNLIGLMNFSKQGDIFIPEASSAFAQLHKRSTVSITDSVFIGQNKLVLIVPKGNPQKISPNLNELLKQGNSVAIANPETSSLGFETRKMIAAVNSYKSFSKNMVSMTIDSRGLDKMVQNNEAEYAIGWAMMASHLTQNSSIDTLNIVPDYSAPIYLGLMSCSKNNMFAKYFMDFVSSGEHSDILQRNGLRKRRTQVF